MQQIIRGLYTFKGLYIGRVYMTVDEDGLTLIDAGVSSSPKAILKQIGKVGYTPEDVKRILVTHAHSDHVGGLAIMKELTGAKVYASSAERPILEGKIVVPRPPREKLTGLAKLMRPPDAYLLPARVDHELHDGDIINESFGGLHVIATPGHSPGHVSFWQPDRGVLFCGDTMLNYNKVRLPIAAFTFDMEQNKASIKKLARLDVSIICFGHGKPIMDNAANLLRVFARSM